MSGNSGTFEQAFNLLCDEKIGRGSAREVYSSKLLPNSVIKVETYRGSFQNVVEWETWKAAKGTPASRWLAECQWISGNGEILIMERTRPPSDKELLRMMPSFLHDFKRENYGMSKDKKGGEWLVCHDYGSTSANVIEHGLNVGKKKVVWRGES